MYLIPNWFNNLRLEVEMMKDALSISDSGEPNGFYIRAVLVEPETKEIKYVTTVPIHFTEESINV